MRERKYDKFKKTKKIFNGKGLNVNDFACARIARGIKERNKNKRREKRFKRKVKKAKELDEYNSLFSSTCYARSRARKLFLWNCGCFKTRSNKLNKLKKNRKIQKIYDRYNSIRKLKKKKRENVRLNNV